MLKETLEKLQDMIPDKPSINPKRFKDPVAKQTDWTLLSAEAANFRTHKLVTISPSRVELRPTFGGFLFAFVFMLVGMVTLGVFGILFTTKPLSFWMLIPLAIGLIFGGVGVQLLRKISTPMVFDKTRGYFWKGGEMPQNLGFSPVEEPDFARLDEIHALQLLEDSIDDETSSQLNLVLHDGRRIHIVSQSGGQKTRMDILRLSGFLDVPLWDAT